MSRERRLRPAFHPLTPAVVLLLVLGALLWAPARPAWSDDRELLRAVSGKPYVFFMLDTSGSMNEEPETATNALAAGDDPESKLYQAKEALYEVITEFNDIFYGFGTFNQDQLKALRKHWIYKPLTAPWPTATLGYPLQDQGYAFGGGGNSPDIQFSCTSPRAVPATGANFRELIGYPRTGDAGSLTFGAWVKQTRTYFVETKIITGALGDPSLVVQHRRRRLSTGNTNQRCGNNPPSNSTFDEDTTSNVVYSLVTDALLQDQINDKDTLPLSAGQQQKDDSTCKGWEPNTDGTADPYTFASGTKTVNLKYPTTVNPDPLFSSNWRFNRGDVLPFDWTRDNRQEIFYRLAPNLRLGETVPDFRVARYFKDTRTSNTALELRNPEVRPILGEGLTPLGNTLEKFRNWYDGWCKTGDATCSPSPGGWAAVAANNDLSWSCRKKYLIMLTDGNETCSNEAGACAAAERLYRDDGITTFVIAFGVASGSANVLNCIAAKGGSTAPVYPQDRTALVTELRNIFNAILENSRTFASAAVPAVQAEVQDKIYLTNFSPLDKNAYWYGHVDAYLKPLPLKDGEPDKSKVCSGSTTSRCLVWDAAVKILNLAPSAADLAAATPNFHIGSGPAERRVFYTQAQTGSTVPNTRKLLTGPASGSKDVDLWTGMGIVPPAVDLSNAAAVNAANAEVVRILKSTYKIKTDILNAVGKPPENITYLLGDIFHSNPVLLSTPNRARYFSLNLKQNNKTCDEGDRGYRCFASKHQLRRKMLIVGSNDQQLHIFDAGIFRGDRETGKFDDGTGYEIYSYVPRPLLPNLKVLAATGASQHWGVDGTLQLDDVYIDPTHNGTPDDNDRAWRTVGIGGLREGGNGYYALDLTQPDRLDSEGVPQPLSTWVPSCWNGGVDCGPVPFGAVLWNFTDTTDEETVPNGYPDLGQTWSAPNTGLVRVKVSESPLKYEDKFVTIFGGGMDPQNLNQQGNWLYIVDIETGKAIYKRQLVGSAPSDPAAVDTDQDGYLDTIYIGTTAGYLYKADLRTAALLKENTVTRKIEIADTVWDPFVIFDTRQSDGRRGPIYFPPSVIFVTQLGRYALAFGTGNRFDLWEKDGVPGRFYVILDENFQQGFTPARTETDYTDITGVDVAAPGSNLLLRPPTGNKAGWYMRLSADQRMITKAFALSGITIFTAYNPRPDVVEEGAVCSRAGETRIFTLYTTNGDRLDPSVSIDGEVRSDFVTNPFVETSATKNKPNEPCDPAAGDCEPDVPLCAEKSEVTRRLKEMFPDNCQFANFTQNIETIQSNNGLVCIAPVPICVARKNWKEN